MTCENQLHRRGRLSSRRPRAQCSQANLHPMDTPYNTAYSLTSNHALPNTPAYLSEKPTIKYVCLKQQQLMSLRVTLSHGNVTGALSDVWTLTRHLCCSSVQTAPPCDLRTPSFSSLEFSWHKWRLPQRHHPSLTLTTAFMSLIHLWLLCCGFVLLFKNIYWHLKLSFYLSRSLSTTWLAPPCILNNGTWYAGNT